MTASQDIRDALDPPLGEALRVPPFSGLNAATQRQVFAKAAARRFEDGAFIFRESDRAEEVFLVVSGAVRLHRMTERGDRIILHYVPAGGLFGIAHMSSNASYTTTCSAVADSLILAWRIEDWAELAKAHPGLAAFSSKTMGRRYKDLSEHVVELATLAVEGRVAKRILALSELVGRDIRGGTEIALPLTRQDLADATGATMHSVSRIMSKWQRAGIVESRRRKVIVRAKSALKAIAGTPAASSSGATI